MGNLVDINYYKNKLHALEKKESRENKWNNAFNYNSDIVSLTDKQ